jgi:hypothetical protein
MKTILIAFRCQTKDEVLKIFQDTPYSLVVIDSLSQKISLAVKSSIAFIDEDFDGIDSGWVLASKLRKSETRVKIVMLVSRNFREYQDSKFKLNYDWIMRYSTLSAEQIFSEIERPWNYLNEIG